MTRRLAGTLMLAAVIWLIASCDGEEDGRSRDEFVDEGDRLCASYNETSGRLIAQIVDEERREEGADSLAASGPVLKEMADALRDHAVGLEALNAPEDDEAAFAAVLDLLRQGASALADAAQSAAEGDLPRTQQSFELYSKSVDTAAAWASRYGFRACARRVAMEETEEGEIEGPPLAPSELAAFCDEVARFSDALTNLPRDAEPTELEEQLLDLSLRAAALADLPPPGTGSALAELRNTLEAVSKEAAEHGYDLRAAAAAGTDVLAPLESARAAFEIRVFGIGACSST